MDSAMSQIQVGIPIVLAWILATAFGLTLRCELGWRRLILIVLTTAILLLPLLVPAQYPLHRVIVVFVCLPTALKLYDVHRAARLARLPSWPAYLTFIVHPFTLVQRKLADETRPPIRRNIVLLWRGIAISAISFVVCRYIWRINFINTPFVVEHVIKTVSFMSLVYGLINVATAAWRLPGWRARPHLHNFFLACTPADFWRRYSRVIGQFLYEDVFKQVGGRRAPIRATLIVFAISGLMHEYAFGIVTERLQGYQMAFFMSQGLAVAATQHLKPQSRHAVLWTVGTFAFNLATSVLFFASVNQVWPGWHGLA